MPHWINRRSKRGVNGATTRNSPSTTERIEGCTTDQLRKVECDDKSVISPRCVEAFVFPAAQVTLGKRPIAKCHDLRSALLALVPRELPGTLDFQVLDFHLSDYQLYQELLARSLALFNGKHCSK